MTNMTYAQALEIAIASVADETAVEKLKALKAQVEKKRTSSTPTKTQIANEGVKAEILEVLAQVDEPITVTEIIGLMKETYNNQKISALLRQLKEAGKVVKTIDKKVSRFALA